MIIVDGIEHPWRKGMTVSELLEELNDDQNCAVVRINKKHVSRPSFEKALIPDNSEVFLLPMIAGG